MDDSIRSEEKIENSCERIEECPFFTGRLASYAPRIVESMKRVYCLGDHVRCARYVVFESLGKGWAPKDMSPVDHERARHIIAEAEKTRPVTR